MLPACSETQHHWCNNCSFQQLVHLLWASWPLLPGRCLHPLLQQNTVCLDPTSVLYCLYTCCSMGGGKYPEIYCFLYKAHLRRGYVLRASCLQPCDQPWYENVCSASSSMLICVFSKSVIPCGYVLPTYMIDCFLNYSCHYHS